MTDLQIVAEGIRRSRRQTALRMLQMIEVCAASRDYDAALAIGERLIALTEADESDRRAFVRRGLLVLRAVAWLALVLVLGATVMLASR